MKSSSSISFREEQFQNALAEYRTTGSKKAWDEIYYRIYDCVHNICAKLLVGVRIDPELFHDRVMDAALYTLKRVKQGLNPGKLSSYCYLVCKGVIHGPKVKWEDTNIKYVGEFYPEVEYGAAN